MKKNQEPEVSMVIITKNEEKMLGNCLDSIKGIGEIIVNDGGSSDKTVEIARKAGARVIRQKGDNFSSWRNQGIKAARGNWIFYIDADERATPELTKEIKKVIISHQFAAYAIPRRNFYLGKEMHYGGAWPDYVKRFFIKEKLKRWERKLHEDPVFEGKLGYLKEPLIHITHRDLSSMVEKTKNWSKVEAELLYQNYPDGHPQITWWRIMKIMLSEFWQRGIKKQGLRDGTVGWIEVIFQVFSRFITYSRLWEMQCQGQRKKK